LIHIHDAAAVSQYTLVVSNAPETYLEIDSAGDMAGVRLPDDLRLCRRVPAPDTPRDALLQLVTLARMERKCLEDAAQVLAWLDAQGSQGQE